MNLFEASIDGDDVTFGEFRVPLDHARRPSATPAGRVILGIRPETFEDAAFPVAELLTLDVDVVVVELGSDAHVFFRVDAARIATETVEGEEDDGAELVSQRALCSMRESTHEPRRGWETMRGSPSIRRGFTSSMSRAARRCSAPTGTAPGAAESAAL